MTSGYCELVLLLRFSTPTGSATSFRSSNVGRKKNSFDRSNF